MNTELNAAKPEISTFMQDVNKNNQEVRDSFCQSELANAQKFAELDREVAELREQISRVANNISVHHHHHHHHKHQGLGHLARSVSRVTAAVANVSSVSRLFSFLVDYSGMF